MTSTQIETEPVRAFVELGREWRALELQATSLSIFQSWTWVGCLAEERYADPVLVRARRGDHTVGLALFNRRNGRLHLAESGHAALDAPFIEHNAPLLAATAGSECPAALLNAALRISGARRVVLSGAPPSLVAAAGTPFRLQQRQAPFVDLDAVRRGGGDYLATLSANSRQQLRRSLRSHARHGPITVVAADPATAPTLLNALVDLHERYWNARGRAGAFSTAFARRFHASLVIDAAARGELELLHCSAGTNTIGYLYGLRLRGHVYAYQSGFDRGDAGPREKPGLTCHLLAIERALALGDQRYDFLAGDDRYKRSLANASVAMCWAELVPRGSLRGMAARLRASIVARTGNLPRTG